MNQDQTTNAVPGEFPIAKTLAQLEVLAKAHNVHPGYIDASFTPTSEDAAELYKFRWTLWGLIEALNVVRIDPASAERIANVTLARRHLEDAHHRLTLALEL